MKIEKRNYSHNPWRLIDDEGREVDYICPRYGYTLPVCAATKRELVEKILEAYGTCRSELSSAKLLIFAMEATSTEGMNIVA
jgi:hypothetical protein